MYVNVLGLVWLIEEVRLLFSLLFCVFGVVLLVEVFVLMLVVIINSSNIFDIFFICGKKFNFVNL